MRGFFDAVNARVLIKTLAFRVPGDLQLLLDYLLRSGARDPRQPLLREYCQIGAIFARDLLGADGWRLAQRQLAPVTGDVQVGKA